LWIQPGVYPATADRRILGALWPNGGSQGADVSVVSGNTLRVSPFTVAIPSVNGTGSVVCVSDDFEQILMPNAPAAGLNRFDLLIIRPRAVDLGTGPNNDFILDFVEGQVAPSPPWPDAPPGTLALVRIWRPGGTAAIDFGWMTDIRPFFMQTDFQGVEQGFVVQPDSGFDWNLWGWDAVYHGQTINFRPVPWWTHCLVQMQCVMRAESTPTLARTGWWSRVVSGPGHGATAWWLDYSLDHSIGVHDNRSISRFGWMACAPNTHIQFMVGLGIEPGWGHNFTHWYNFRTLVSRTRALVGRPPSIDA
jgi:hypothetical protein